jgi:hypothetical protein
VEHKGSMTIIERLELWLDENGGASACYLGPPSPLGVLLFVTRPLGPRDEGLADAVLALEEELARDGHHVSAFVLEAGDEFELAEALGLPACVPVYRKPPRMAA